MMMFLPTPFSVAYCTCDDYYSILLVYVFGLVKTLNSDHCSQTNWICMMNTMNKKMLLNWCLRRKFVLNCPNERVNQLNTYDDLDFVVLIDLYFVNSDMDQLDHLHFPVYLVVHGQIDDSWVCFQYRSVDLLLK